MDRSPLSVEEFVEYCRVQAGLLLGSVQTMAEEADTMLDDIDEEMAEIRSELNQGAENATTTPTSPETPGTDVNVEAVEERESTLREQQAMVEATETRMELFQNLASGYTDLADDLQGSETDVDEAMERVVQFEATNDAPAYFDDRETLVEVVQAAEDDDSVD